MTIPAPHLTLAIDAVRGCVDGVGRTGDTYLIAAGWAADLTSDELPACEAVGAGRTSTAQAGLVRPDVAADLRQNWGRTLPEAGFLAAFVPRTGTSQQRLTVRAARGGGVETVAVDVDLEPPLAAVAERLDGWQFHVEAVCEGDAVFVEPPDRTTFAFAAPAVIRVWAFDERSPSALDSLRVVTGDGTALAIPGIDRPDVAAAFGRSDVSPRVFLVPVVPPSCGTEHLRLRAINGDRTAATDVALLRIIRPASASPLTLPLRASGPGRIDELRVSRAGTAAELCVRGWSLDPDYGLPAADVVVTVDGVPIPVEHARPRDDVAAAHGSEARYCEFEARCTVAPERGEFEVTVDAITRRRDARVRLEDRRVSFDGNS